MLKWDSLESAEKIAAEMPFEKRFEGKSVYSMLSRTVMKYSGLPAVSFQIEAGPKSGSETLNWGQLLGKVTQTANGLKSLGIGKKDKVAYILPNCSEAVITFLAGSTAGIVVPMSPLLEPDQMAGILNLAEVKVVVTLKSLPKTDVAQKVALALEKSPTVTHLVEVDLVRYLKFPKSIIAPLIRPKVKGNHGAITVPFEDMLASQSSSSLTFKDDGKDRTAAMFHTGGTTGTPKLAKHSFTGMLYQGWSMNRALTSWSEKESVLCPLPMFHVFAAYPNVMACVASGAHIIFVTPQGYRGDGVFDNFWSLVEKWKASFITIVPTAAAELMQRPINADVSSLKYALCGSAPLPQDLFKKFETSTGIKIIEGYGMTESTCLISGNPVDGGIRKIGSVGIPFPYTKIKIAKEGSDVSKIKACKVNEIGEVCVSNPGVIPGQTYTDNNKNKDLFYERDYLRTGDLGYLDKDGYLYITGRAKDLIIRGGHNIDPALAEEAIASHPSVAMVGVIGQPEARLGEVPCAYVELVKEENVEPSELLEHAKNNIGEKAAIPKHFDIVEEMPKTPIGKIFKPELRKRAIARVYDEALKKAELKAKVKEVIDHPNKGLTAVIAKNGENDTKQIGKVLDKFIYAWE